MADETGGLPVAVSTLVGRERERAEVAGLVAATRLVTLTGAGGCGKTRLALEVAHDVASRFEHGAWWVELWGVGDPGSVAQALADAVGVREEPGRALVDTLIDNLRARHGLVVLDNCEHVVGACVSNRATASAVATASADRACGSGTRSGGTSQVASSRKVALPTNPRRRGLLGRARIPVALDT